MNKSNLRYGVMAIAFTGSLLTGPSESQAIFHWCRGCRSAPVAPAAPAYVAPPAVAYYAPCAPPTVVNYVPQTYFRPVVVNTPVTSFQPVTSCGLCGPSTTMRPVTTMVQSTQYVPYTSYRLMYSAAYPAYTANYVAPAVMAPPVMAPAPAQPCCGAGAPAAVDPGVPGAMPAPSLSGPVPGVANYGAAPAGTTIYAPPSTSNYAAPATPGTANYGSSATPGTSNYGSSPSLGTPSYSPSKPITPSQPGSDNAPTYDPLHPTTPPDIHLKPVPEDPAPQAGPTSAPPRQLDVDNRTAIRPVSGAASMPAGVIPAAYTQPTAAMPNAAWRPSSR